MTIHSNGYRDIHHCDVLIVGAGPTGLTLAIELARRGISYRIIDKCAHPSIYSKALGVMARTLELLHQAEVADTLIDQGHQVTGMQASSYTKVLAQVEFPSLIQSHYPYVLMVPQNITEQVTRHDDVKLLWVFQQLHGTVVNVHVA